jgi:hypothetical protein
MDLTRPKSMARLSLSSGSHSSSLTMANLRRLGRKSRPASISSSSSLSSSVQSSCCVNRDTASDDCDLQRFMVWAAVRRNLSIRITDDERRQCPLLDCKQSFEDHERMLQHLYCCEHLASGRYWCHECDRAERFSNAKDRRCLKDPSMRRKLISKAKTFWQSLGSKANGTPVHPFPLDQSTLDFGFPLENPQEKAELPSDANEIFEMDSDEAWNWNNAQAVPMNVEAMVNPPPNNQQPPPFSPTDYRLTISQWQAQNNSHAPPPVSEQAYYMAQGAPSFQPASDPSPDQAQQNMRLNKVSVRSTASAASTTSNISNFSTWSNVSGVSSVSTSTNLSAVPILSSSAAVWHESTWNKAPEMDLDNMALATNPLMSQYNAIPENAFAHGPSHQLDELPTISELPADQPIEYSSPPHPALTTNFAQLLAAQPLGVPLAPLTSPVEPNMGSSEHTNGANVARNVDADGIEAVPRAVDSVLEPVWDLLRDHISCSQEGLKNLPSNALAVQLTQLNPESMIAAGFATAKHMLHDRQMTREPLDAICFAHVVFSLGFALDDRYTKARTNDMYQQTLLYGMWFEPAVREAYQEVCSAIWETTETDNAAGPHTLALPSTTTYSHRGMEPCRSVLAADPLVSMAQFFLDKLEGAVLEDSSVSSIGSKPSSLATRHDKESGTFVVGNMAHALERVKDALLSAYASHPAFATNIESVIHFSMTGTVRRAELGLLQLGRVRLDAR